MYLSIASTKCFETFIFRLQNVLGILYLYSTFQFWDKNKYRFHITQYKSSERVKFKVTVSMSITNSKILARIIPWRGTWSTELGQVHLAWALQFKETSQLRAPVSGVRVLHYNNTNIGVHAHCIRKSYTFVFGPS